MREEEGRVQSRNIHVYMSAMCTHLYLAILHGPLGKDRAANTLAPACTHAPAHLQLATVHGLAGSRGVSRLHLGLTDSSVK